jgi:acetylornithine deacetylase/succinyl-diaminopimelate desuccinylase-like protein
LADTIAEIDAFLERTAPARLEEYQAFLRIPSISALSEHAGDMRIAADWLADQLRDIGIEHVEVSQTAGHPIVYGDWLRADGAPTVLVYGHYDVQPVDPLNLWKRPPFEPRVEDGRIYARGSADDKGQVHMQVWAARAWLETQKHLPVNIRYVFEGEEESGSVNFDAWLEANRHRLGADLAVISDTGFFEGNLPAICIGLRGLMYAQIDVTGPELDLHSGGFGGNVQNPAIALAKIIAALKSDDGSITVPGFYDEVRPISEHDHAEFARLPLDEAEVAHRIGVPELFGEPGLLYVERQGARPTLDINGIWGGFQGEGSKTIIPAHAHAKLSCRLVADMDPRRTFERVRDRILELAPPGVRAEVTLINEGMWSLTGIDHPATQAAARCLKEVFGADPLYERGGGSIPAAASFSSMLGLAVVLLGFANPDCQAHAPNESMILANYEGGVRTVARYWAALGEGLGAPAKGAGEATASQGGASRS